MRLFEALTTRAFSILLKSRFMVKCIGLVFSGGIVFADNVTSLGDSKDLLNTLPIEPTKTFNFTIPTRPAGQILDTAHFLAPDAKQALNDSLSQEARDHGVHVFVLVVPSVEKGALAQFTQAVCRDWMSGLFGAVLVFDDGTGKVAIQQSDEVSKRYYEFELSQQLRDTKDPAKRPRLSRDGLGFTAKSVCAGLRELKMRADRADRKARITQFGLGGICLLAFLIGSWQYLRKTTIALSE